MKKLSTNEIRKMWLDFFEQKGHYIEESKSLIPVDDDSILFINSGVATLKKYFSGIEKPPKNKIANAQKALRTNDIENVGLTARHHTIFEMLGNFSIGDYFKKEAISYMFEILFSPEWFDFDIKDFYFTIHPNDEESYQILLANNVKEERIIKLEENFWEIGEGPGGPNLEIFYDRGEKYSKIDPRKLLEEDIENDRVIEIWNIVFSQYNCMPGTKKRNDYEELPHKNIDTGMGLERMACVLQEVETNFETDNFMKIIKEIEKITNLKYENNQKSFRIIADHIRALTFAIADGITPSNTKRGYVIRRLLRRALKYGYNDLKIKEAFLYKLVPAVIETYKDFYTYLIPKEEYIKEIIKEEENKFLKTINNGIELLEKEINKINNNVLSGEIAFKLYDTYGFPYELTEEICLEKNINVDKKTYEEQLNKQKELAKKNAKETVAINLQNSFLQEINVTSEFVGYDKLSVSTKIELITNLSEELNECNEGINYIILKENPFYAESGGQVADHGYINKINKVIDCIKLANGQHLLKVEVNELLKKGDVVLAEVDKKRREQIEKNHSATHLLHLALRENLGMNATQKGSLQDENKTRFDFNYNNPLTSKQIDKITIDVNNYINENNDCIIEIMNLEDAKKMNAMALFGEKYFEKVRVVKIGKSIELCGGTHVKNSKDIGYFYIINESGIGSGIRRIEAITGEKVIEYYDKIKIMFDEEINLIEEKIKKYEKINLDNIEKIYNEINKIEKILKIKSNYQQIYDNIIMKINDYKKEQKEQEKNQIINLTNKYKDLIKSDNNINYLFVKEENIDPKNVRIIIDNLFNETNVNIVLFDVKNNDKNIVVVKNNLDNLSAKEILNDYLKKVNGHGGGNQNMAQGGYN